MLRHLSKTVGSALAALCLVSTLAMAQSQSSHPPIPRGQNPLVYRNQARPPSPAQPQYMTCSKDNGQGHCIAARMADGREIGVIGPGAAGGDLMTCVDKGNVVDCKPAS